MGRIVCVFFFGFWLLGFMGAMVGGSASRARTVRV